jgi:hypothetical protein
MWRRSFVATTVALGGTLDDALAAIPPSAHTEQLDDLVTVGAPPQTPEIGLRRSAALHDLVTRLRAPTRPARASALATAVRDIIVAIDRTTLR